MNHNPGGKRKPKWPLDSTVNVDFSKCGKYRYSLTEIWANDQPLVMFLMMNPSVANIDHADPTIIKTGKYARRWGFGGQIIGNVHAFRTTDKRGLSKVIDPVGPRNDLALMDLAKKAQVIVLACGLPPKHLQQRTCTVIDMLKPSHRLKYLKLTKNGTPCHPLYLKQDIKPRDYP